MLRHRFVRAALEHLAEQAGYSGPLAVTLRRTTYEAERDRRRVDMAVDERSDYGITLTGSSSGPTPFVYVNPLTNTTIDRLMRTLSHEAIHVAYPDHPHGPSLEAKALRLRRLERL